jgi:glutathione S-transferase
MMLRLHDYAASANCLKVRMLLAQLGRPYERVPVDIFAGETLTDDFGRMNPARSTPVLELETGEFLVESNAILLYLAEGTPLLPDDPLTRAQVYRWLFFEQADVVPSMGGLRFRLLTGRIDPDGDEARRRRSAADATLAVLDEVLTERAFLAGERYTVADLGVFAYAHVAPDARIDLTRFPSVSAWLERVAAQPGHVNDLEPYPPNARPGAGRSIYDG